MKKKFFTIIIILFVAIISTQIKAQTTIACYEDTVILRLNGYIGGQIQWEQSSDSINWFEINNANFDTLFIGKITESSNYYRVKVTANNCNPVYSFISKVIVDFAEAGFDRDINGDSLILDARPCLSGTGYWSIMSGVGGHIYDTLNPKSPFKGLLDNEYMLLWHVTNSCGTTMDIVTINFHRTILHNNIVVIDTINTLLSDSTELGIGIYRVKFNSTIPDISDSTYIIGYTNGGYLRKVVEVYRTDSILTMHTQTATMENIFESGAINFMLNLSNMDSTTNSKSKLVNENYLKLLSSKINYLAPGVTINNSKSALGSGFRYDFNNVIIYQNGPLNLKITNGYVKFEPNFVCDFKYDQELKKLYLYADNAILEVSADINLNCSQQYTLLDTKKKLASYEKNWAFMVGWIPVIISMNVDLVAKHKAVIGASINATTGYTHTDRLSLGIIYDNQVWQNIYSCSSQDNFKPLLMNTQVDLSQRFEIVPEVSVKIYGIAGPYIKPVVYEELNGNFNLTSSNWNVGLKAGFNAEIGAEVTIFGKTLANYSKTFIGPSKSYISPSSIEIVSGNNQSGTINQPLPAPIKVKIKDNIGIAWPFVKVYFEVVSGSGSITSSIVTTDLNGNAETNWTMGNILGAQQLKISIKNADGSDAGSPVYCSANTTNLCANFNVNAWALNDSVAASAIGGVAPYYYSMNGITYSQNAKFYGVSSGVKPVFAKDFNNCKAVTSVLVVNPCSSNNIVLNTSVSSSNSLHVEALINNFEPPEMYFMFSINGTNYQYNNLFTGLSQGNYTVYAKDPNGCIFTANASIINSNSTTTLNITSTVNGNIITASATGGTPPYTYSKNGTNYNTSNIFNGLPPNNYTIYVKDAVNCIKSTTATVTNSSCSSTTLSINKTISSNNISISATGGTPPYLYSINGTSYGNNNLFNNNSNGTYTLYVKDAATCIKTTSAIINTSNHSPNIPANIYPQNGETNIPRTSLRTWTASDPDGDTLQYKYYFGTSNPPAYIGMTSINYQNNGTLQPNTTYYWKVTAVDNQNLAATSQVMHFTTACSSCLTLPVTVTTSVTNIAQNSAIINGVASSDGGSPITARGVCWSTNPNPTIANSFLNNGTGTGVFNCSLSGLSANTTYYVRTFATNSVGNAYGNIMDFKTIQSLQIPSLTTLPVTAIKATSANSGGVNILPNPNECSRGICWNTLPNPTITDNHTTNFGDTNSSFKNNLFNLIPNTTYFVRAYATNLFGTGYGNSISFTTQSATTGTVIDFDGNIYDTIQIGTKIWMKQNLKTTHYSNGDVIPKIDNDLAWSNLTTGGYCNYGNDTNNSLIYGKLYNYYTVMDSRKLCPIGWHIPSLGEFSTLLHDIGLTNSGDKLKEVGTTHWWTQDYMNSANETGFTAIPAGERSEPGTYYFIQQTERWWLSSSLNTFSKWYFSVTYGSHNAGSDFDNQRKGFSVRCVKDYLQNQLSIGQTYLGGIIAYILQPGDSGFDTNIQHGLIAAPSDQIMAPFGCNGIAFGVNWNAGSLISLGTGHSNTYGIISACNTVGIAAKICKNLVLNGYDDWYLPSKDELNKLYINRLSIGGFTNYNYWSSSESDASNAWSQNFSNGNQYTNGKGNSGYVRAVRDF